MLGAFVIIALVATLAILFAGIVAMLRGGAFNAEYGNKLMRARVALQAVAVGLMAIIYLLNRSGG